jgi:hypothetical protein
MTVIKPGVVPPAGVLRGTCRRCGCVVGCPADEARVFSAPGDPEVYRYVPCPTPGCGAEYLVVKEVGR